MDRKKTKKFGVGVKVKTTYLPEYSNPNQAHFVFEYEITIENFSDHTVQLLRRHWYIHDTYGRLREVEGVGVVGEQPVLEPGETYQYISGCNLNTAIGKMRGYYTMELLMDGTSFKVIIPEFVMEVPYRLN